MVDQGGIFIHFLQPNQYVSGSKPLGNHEKQIAFSAQSLYKNPVETGYPYLRAVGQRLNGAGIWFEDLTGIFASATRELYIDNCCHVNKEGNEFLARAIAAALATRMSNGADGRNRAVPIDQVNLRDSLFAPDELRRFVADSSAYQDGSEEPAWWRKSRRRP
jgi:hypothetical protein